MRRVSVPLIVAAACGIAILCAIGGLFAFMNLRESDLQQVVILNTTSHDLVVSIEHVADNFVCPKGERRMLPKRVYRGRIEGIYAFDVNDKLRKTKIYPKKRSKIKVFRPIAFETRSILEF